MYPQKVGNYKQKFFLLSSCRSLNENSRIRIRFSQRYGSADPAPYKNVTDLQNCIKVYPSSKQLQLFC
jgi:hypothetical protein